MAAAPLLGETVVALTVAQALVRLRFRRYARWVGQSGPTAPAPVDASALETARRVRWAVGAVARRASPLGVCLPQALAAKWCLGRRGVPTTLHIGVLRCPDDGGIGAHAWLMCGDVVVTGSGARPRCTSLVAFA
jgi:hypothetical protein